MKIRSCDQSYYLFPGMCTGIKAVPSDQCDLHMQKAHDVYLLVMHSLSLGNMVQSRD
jgi:hypothetical protein